MDAKHSLVRKWLVKARRDLLSAKRLARGSEPYLDTAIYHCQEENYSLTPQGSTLHEGDRISVFHTKKGSYTEGVAGAVTETCNSGCFAQCMDNCTYVELQDCYLRCITGCINGLCDGWDTEEKCYEVQNRLNCNLSCYTQCADSYNQQTQISY